MAGSNCKEVFQNFFGSKISKLCTLGGLLNSTESTMEGEVLALPMDGGDGHH